MVASEKKVHTHNTIKGIESKCIFSDAQCSSCSIPFMVLCICIVLSTAADKRRGPSTAFTPHRNGTGHEQPGADTKASALPRMWPYFRQHPGPRLSQSARTQATGNQQGDPSTGFSSLPAGTQGAPHSSRWAS